MYTGQQKHMYRFILPSDMIQKRGIKRLDAFDRYECDFQNVEVLTIPIHPFELPDTSNLSYRMTRCVNQLRRI